ncbi:MAG: four helix bundle protein [Flavobacteriaceae bacterium]
MNHNFRKLNIWKDGMSLVQETYKSVRTFPDFEKYNLSSQLIRCAVSIPSNIAEGSSKNSDKHFNRFLENSLGSAFEWETQINIAFNEGYLPEIRFKKLEEKIQTLQKMIPKFQGGLDV